MADTHTRSLTKIVKRVLIFTIACSCAVITSLYVKRRIDDHLTVRLYLEGILDYGSKERKMTTALVKAIRNGDKRAVVLFLDKGADPGCETWEIPVHVAAESCRDPDVLRILIARGGNVNRLYGGSTPLHHAVSAANAPAVEALIADGADLEIRNCRGMTALQIAVTKSDESMVKLLLDRGADFDARDRRGVTLRELWQRKLADKRHVVLLAWNGGSPVYILDGRRVGTGRKGWDKLFMEISKIPRGDILEVPGLSAAPNMQFSELGEHARKRGIKVEHRMLWPDRSGG